MLFNAKVVLIASCFASALGQGEKNLPDDPERRKIPDPFLGICPRDTDPPTRDPPVGDPPVGDHHVKDPPVVKDPPPGLRPRSKAPGGWRWKDWCAIRQPGQVNNFRITCTNASYLDFQIADCCVPGDFWQLKGKDWDRAPNTAVTTSAGRPGDYGVPGRIYNYFGTQQNQGSLEALIECSYLHGVNLFAAGSFVYFESDASSCSVTKTEPADVRIDRSP